MATRNKGTRKNRAAQVQQDMAVLDLRKAGATLQQVADQYFSGHKSNAHRALTRIMSEYPAEAVAELRRLENHRLDQLQVAQWPNALRGNQGAAKVVLSIMERRAKLNGLDSLPDAVAGGNITVMVDGQLLGTGMTEPELIVPASPQDTAGE